MEPGPQITPSSCFGDCYGTIAIEGLGFWVAILLGVTLPRWYFAIPLALALSIVAPLTAIVTRVILFGGIPDWLPLAYPIERPDFWLERAIIFGVFSVAIFGAYAIASLIGLIVRGEAARVFLSLALITALFFSFVATVELSEVPYERWPSLARTDTQFTFTELHAVFGHLGAFVMLLIVIVQLAQVQGVSALARSLLAHRETGGK